MNSAEQKLTAITAIFGLISIPILIYLHAFTMQKLYTWFVAQTFHTPEISTAQAYGLGILIIFASNGVKPRKQDDSSFMSSLAYSYAQPLGALLIGYITKTYFL